MYCLKIKEEVDRIFKRLIKKNPKQLQIINKKISEILTEPYGYKFLRKPLQGFNRVHIDKHFVLVFKINREKEMITLYYFNHHDYVYKWQPK